MVLIALLALLASSGPAASVPRFGADGGIGSLTATVSTGEPTGGMHNINGKAGQASYGSMTTAGPASVGILTLTGAGAGSALAKQLPSTCANILTYGGDPTGANDNVAAFHSAAKASETAVGSSCVYLPGGNYHFASAVSISLASGSNTASAAVVGDGSDETNLVFAAGVNGIGITLNANQQSFHVRSMSIITAGASARTQGLTVTQANGQSSNLTQSDVSGVTFRGTTGYSGANYWGYGARNISVSNVDFINDAVTCGAVSSGYGTNGVGIQGEGLTSPLAIPVVLNIIGTQIDNCHYGFVYGSLLQGVSIVSSNFTGNGIGVYQASSNTGNDQLAITASQFNNGTYDIALGAPLDAVTITANDFYLAPGGGSSIDTIGNQLAIQGNAFIMLPGSAAGNGITVGAYNVDSAVITGNTFSGFKIAILLATGSQHINVQSNAYNGNTANVLNNGINNTVGGGSQ